MGVAEVSEVRLSAGGTEACVTASGAAVRSLRFSGRHLVREFPAGTHPAPGATNIVLAPWPNRVADATYSFGGETRQLEVTEPELGHALHGFTWRRLFEFADASSDSCTLHSVLGPEPGWPWPIDLTVTYRLIDGGIVGEMTAVNLSDEPAPCALGVHTYLSALGAPLDECTLHHSMTQRQPLDSRNIPDGPREVWPQNPIAMNGVWLDDSGFDPRFEPHVATLLNKEGHGVELSASESMRWTQVFTSPQRHLAVEPMTAPPNSLVSGEDLNVLEPDGRLTVSWTVRAIT